MTNIKRSDIVSQARTWIGTSFKHQGRSKKNDKNSGGCDCIGLLVGVFSELNISICNGMNIETLDRTDYSRIPDGNRLKEVLDSNFDIVPLNEIDIGDIVLIKFHKNPQHVGIISDGASGFNIIHCWYGPGKVVEHSLSGYWTRSIVSAYKFKNNSSLEM